MFRLPGLLLIFLVLSAASVAPAQDANLLKEILSRMEKRDEILVKEIQALRQDLKTFLPSNPAPAPKAQDIADQVQIKILIERNHLLLRRIQELEEMIAKSSSERLVAPTGNGLTNPPKALLKGKITRIDANDGTVVEVNLGRDTGLEKGHTLEVYRLEPRPAYLGMVRVLEVHAGTAVTRLVSPNPLKRSALQVGDSVNSRLDAK